MSANLCFDGDVRSMKRRTLRRRRRQVKPTLWLVVPSSVSTTSPSFSLSLSYVYILCVIVKICSLKCNLQVALASSAIFRAVDADVDDDPTNHSTYYGKNGVAWVLRFGGLCALVSRLTLCSTADSPYDIV